jgi:hypothetical protein
MRRSSSKPRRRARALARARSPFCLATIALFSILIGEAAKSSPDEAARWDQERDTLRLAKIVNWAVPRYYVRYPNAFVLFDAEDVRTAASYWRDDDLARGIRADLPLKAPTDLYKYTLVGRVPRGASNQIEQFTLDALLAGKAAVFAPTKGGYLERIRVTRTSGEWVFSHLDGTELLREEVSRRDGRIGAVRTRS